MAKAIVSATMAQETAVLAQDVAGYTNVPSVDLLSIMLRRFIADEVFLIVTPFRHWVWKEMLESVGALSKYIDIPAGIEHGFLIELKNFMLTQTFTPDNHCINPEHFEFFSPLFVYSSLYFCSSLIHAETKGCFILRLEYIMAKCLAVLD